MWAHEALPCRTLKFWPKRPKKCHPRARAKKRKKTEKKNENEKVLCVSFLKQTHYNDTRTPRATSATIKKIFKKKGGHSGKAPITPELVGETHEILLHYKILSPPQGPPKNSEKKCCLYTFWLFFRSWKFLLKFDFLGFAFFKICFFFAGLTEFFRITFEPFFFLNETKRTKRENEKKNEKKLQGIDSTGWAPIHFCAKEKWQKQKSLADAVSKTFFFLFSHWCCSWRCCYCCCCCCCLEGSSRSTSSSSSCSSSICVWRKKFLDPGYAKVFWRFCTLLLHVGVRSRLQLTKGPWRGQYW